MSQTTTTKRPGTFTFRLSAEERRRLEQIATTREQTLGATVKAALRALEETTRG